jgi:hypothetical protein
MHSSRLQRPPSYYALRPDKRIWRKLAAHSTGALAYDFDVGVVPLTSLSLQPACSTWLGEGPSFTDLTGIFGA